MTTKLYKDPLNMIVAGVGGQGNLVISSLVGDALVGTGCYVAVGETYGASQRGGAVMSHVRISQEMQYGPLIPNARADVVVGMEPLETLRVLAQYGNPDVITIVNPRPIIPLSVLSGDAQYAEVDKFIDAIKSISRKTYVVNATEEAQKMGNTMLTNVILIGALLALDLMPLDKKTMEGILRERFPKALELNLKAFEKGMELLAKAGAASK
jgi:indolepyruvate ferredoxin oxidoreductase, beta subunit